MTTCNQCGGDGQRHLFTSEGFRLVACTRCNLAYIANPPSAAQLEQYYSGDGTYHRNLRDPAGAEWKRADAIADAHLHFLQRVTRSGSLLDVGCSTGQFLAKARAAGFEVSGSEFSAASAAFARARFGLTIKQGSLHDCSHPAGSLDVLTMFDVIEHVPDPAADMLLAWNLLKPGGWFILSTPNLDGLFPRLSFLVASRIGYWPHPEPPGHLYQFSVDTLSAMLVKTGFEPGQVWHRNIDLAYTFGKPETLVRMPKRLAYALAFALPAKLGPLIGQGDWFYIAARKPE